jgi:hypothetical protein
MGDIDRINAKIRALWEEKERKGLAPKQPTTALELLNDLEIFLDIPPTKPDKPKLSERCHCNNDLTSRGKCEVCHQWPADCDCDEVVRDE